jgi:hypothetical protein
VTFLKTPFIVFVDLRYLFHSSTIISVPRYLQDIISSVFGVILDTYDSHSSLNNYHQDFASYLTAAFMVLKTPPVPETGDRPGPWRP